MSKVWHAWSAREQRLAAITGVVVAGAVCFLAVSRALGYVHDLDQQIEQRELDLITYTELAARSESVERDFAKIAQAHSSKWSREEIHDRLRQEIDRLARRNPPEPAALLAGDAGGAYLVQIPSVPYGRLSEGDSDYREYQLSFKLAPASIANIAEYLKRLQESPQALRIDGLELARPPEADLVIATIDVTRTVVSGVGDVAGVVSQPAPRGKNLVRNGSFEQWNRESSRFDQWDITGCRPFSSRDWFTDGPVCLGAIGGDLGGSVSQLQELEAGKVYELRADVTANGAVRIGVADEKGENLFDGVREITADGLTRRYVFRFTAPGVPGAAVRLRVPFVELKGQAASVFMDAVSLTRRAE